MRRINFVADLVGDTSRPGVQSIIERLKAQGELSPQAFIEGCLDLMGPLDVDIETVNELVDHVQKDGSLKWDTDDDVQSSTERIGEMLQLIASLRDYQYA